MNDEKDLTKKLEIIKNVAYLIGSAIITIGVCYGFYWKTTNDIENLKSSQAKTDIIVNQTVDQLNKGILENGIIATELKNNKEDIQELKEFQKETIDLLKELLRSVNKKDRD